MEPEKWGKFPIGISELPGEKFFQVNHVFTPRGAKKSRCRGTSNSVMSEAASSDSSAESSETSDSATLRSWVSFLGQRPSKTYGKFVKTRRKPMKIRRIVLENPTDMVKTLIKDKKKKQKLEAKIQKVEIHLGFLKVCLVGILVSYSGFFSASRYVKTRKFCSSLHVCFSFPWTKSTI